MRLRIKQAFWCSNFQILEHSGFQISRLWMFNSSLHTHSKIGNSHGPRHFRYGTLRLHFPDVTRFLTTAPQRHPLSGTPLFLGDAKLHYFPYNPKISTPNEGFTHCNWQAWFWVVSWLCMNILFLKTLPKDVNWFRHFCPTLFQRSQQNSGLWPPSFLLCLLNDTLLHRIASNINSSFSTWKKPTR